MDIKYIQLAGWHDGMSSIIEQDLPFEKGEPMNSVLFLKNYNPNVILQSLVMREGKDIYDFQNRVITYVDDSNVIPSVKYPVRQFISELLDKGRITANELFIKLNDNLLGWGILETTRPIYFKSPLLFFKSIVDDKTYTDIVSGIIERVNDYYVYKWHNPFYLEKEEGDFTDKGIKVQGELSDFYNYANLVILTTVKARKEWEGIDTYPVYVYAYDDRAKYFKYQFMPYNIQPNQNESTSTWKVRKPLNYLYRTQSVRHLEMMNLSPVYLPLYIRNRSTKDIIGPYEDDYINYMNLRFAYKEGYGYYETMAKTKFSNWKGNLEYPYDSWSINEFSKPLDLVGYENIAAIDNINQNFDKVSNGIDILFWQTDELPSYHKDKEGVPLQFTPEQVTWNFLYSDYDNLRRGDYHLTIEPIQHDMDLYTKVSILPRNINVSGVTYQGSHYPIDTVDINNLQAYYMNLLSVPAKIKYKNTEETYSTKLHPAFTNFSLIKASTNNTDIIGNDVEDAIRYWIDGHKDTHKPFLHFCLPKYSEKDLPRYWLPEEKIPYVLTAVIGGIEVELKRGTYLIPQSYEFEQLQHSPIYTQIWGNGVEWFREIKSNTLRTGNPNTIIRNQHVHLFGNHANRLEYIEVQNAGSEGGPTYGWNPNYFSVQKTDGGWEYGNGVPYPVYSRVPFTMFTIRLNYETLQNALDDLPSEMTEIRLYISAADNTQGLIKRTVDGSLFSPVDMGYAKPLVQDKNDNQYRLVKRFILRGEEGVTNVGNRWGLYNRNTQGIESYAGTNKWAEIKNNDTSDYSNIVTLPNSAVYAIPETWNQQNTSSGQLNFRNMQGYGIQWTPDFYIWDYANTGDFLSENLVATGEEQIWQGKGARLVTVTRGATVIAGCQNEKFEEEEGIIRVSLVQNGNISNELFPEVNKLYVGRAYFTAIVNFREQIILFSQTSLYRVILNDLTNASTWEVFDAIDGQGTFNNKSVAVTPYGVCFANKNSIWFTDGTQINNIGKGIETLYRSSMSNQVVHTFTQLFGQIPNSSDIELVYESKSNELHVISDIGISTFHWIYNFEFKNWRTNEIPTQYNDDKRISAPLYGKVSTKLKSINDEAESGLIRLVTNSIKHDGRIVPYSYINCLTFDYIPSGQIRDNIFTLTDSPIYAHITNEPKNITGTFITHDIGDGINDYLLENVILEMYPLNIELWGSTIRDKYNIDDKDPKLIICPRHLSNANNLSNYNKQNRDIIELNMRDQWQKWLVRTSPTDQSPSDKSRGYITPRESFIYLTPFGVSFRKSIMMFQSNSITMIRTMQLKIRQMIRKIFS